MSTPDSNTMFSRCGLTAQQFLDDFWQNKPLLVPQAFPDFSPALSADDIAGLACEELAESRLITGSFPDHDWQLRYGPFSESDLSKLPASNWTLLVQDVEKHYPPLGALLDSFGFIPRWRIDDLMVSVAGPGGSVGPHVDQYDVFLVQAEGRRSWSIAESFDDELFPGSELNVLSSFSPEQEWTLQPGDMLYLPPGVAHHGVALEMGMTWSVGLRAPSAADLLQALGEWCAGQPGEGGRYRDPALRASHRAGEVDVASIHALQDVLRNGSADNPGFNSFIGSFLSSYRLAHEPAPPPTQFQPGTLAEALDQQGVLKHNPWTRLLWLEQADGVSLFAAGDEFSCSRKLAETLCDSERLSRLQRNACGEELELICELLNRGHLYLERL